MAFDTAGNIIADSAVELGLVGFQAKPADPFASTDPNIGQLCQLLKSTGRTLVREFQWSNLQSIWLFNTSVNQGRYALPADFDRIIDQSGWNRTNRLPLGGPVGPQEFEFFKARLVGVVFNVLFRILQGKFHCYPDDATPGNYAIGYEYVSRWWVTPAATAVTSGPWLPGVAYAQNAVVTSGGNLYTCATAGTSGTTAAPAGIGAGIADGTCVWNYISVAGADSPTASSDVIQIDPQLASAVLKLSWKQEKGLDATSALSDYEDCLAKARSADVAAPVLNFHQSVFAEPLLGERNIPLTGFGGP